MGSDSRNLGLSEEFVVLHFLGLLAFRVGLNEIPDERRCLRLQGSVQDFDVKALFHRYSFVLDGKRLLNLAEVLKRVWQLCAVVCLFD